MAGPSGHANKDSDRGHDQWVGVAFCELCSQAALSFFVQPVGAAEWSTIPISLPRLLDDLETNLRVLIGARVPAQDEGQKRRCIPMNIASSTRVLNMLHRVFFVGV